MSRKLSPIMFFAIALLIGAASIFVVGARSDVRTVDVLQLFAGGMIAGALLSGGIMALRRANTSA